MTESVCVCEDTANKNIHLDENNTCLDLPVWIHC